MKKLLLFILICGNINYFCFAQPGGNFNKAEALQVAYLTKELGLSSEEAQRFWPVFNNYREELKKTRRDNRTDELMFEEKVLNIRKKYSTEFKKIFNNDQRVNRIFQADKNFREILRKELQNRRRNQQKNNRDLPLRQ